jgi:transcriptional regulator with XRE-family HTH domain
MKRFEDEAIKLVGVRIRSARALTGFSQSDFCEKHGLSVGALKTWETGKFAPRAANLAELCRCLEKEGIFNATTSWFLRGEGPAPTHVNGISVNSSRLFSVENNEDINEEIELFTKNQNKRKRQAIVIEIYDDSMAPYFSNGDIVGGIKIDQIPPMTEMANKPFLIEIKPNTYLVRWCFSDGNEMFFKAQNDALIYRVDTKKIGFILWHRYLK